MKKEKKKEDNVKSNIFVGVIFVGIMYWIVSMIMDVGNDNSNSENEKKDIIDPALTEIVYDSVLQKVDTFHIEKATAYYMSQYFVKQKLKSPATAKFPTYDPSLFNEKILYMGKGRYLITSYVDSQNSFGGLMRTKYRCIVRDLNDNSDNWELISLTF